VVYTEVRIVAVRTQEVLAKVQVPYSAGMELDFEFMASVYDLADQYSAMEDSRYIAVQKLGHIQPGNKPLIWAPVRWVGVVGR